MWPQLKEGLAWVIGNRELRAIAASSANFNLCFNIVLAAFLLYAVRSLNGPPGWTPESPRRRCF
jgi:hypothetical protein